MGKTSQDATPGSEIFWAVEGLQKARRIEFSQNGLDYLSADKALEPHETVQGWAFFEIPGKRGVLNGSEVSYRVHVRDTAGVEFVYTGPGVKLGTAEPAMMYNVRPGMLERRGI